jgi:hypothetical protein
MMNFYNRSISFFSRNVILNSIAHAAGGFGLAIVLQQYIQGNAFISVWIGWFLIIISLAIHVRSIYGR